MSSAGRQRAQAAGAEERARSFDRLARGFTAPQPLPSGTRARRNAPFALPAAHPAALVAEFNRLFVGPGHLPAPPYESVYRDGWTVMGESTLDVVRHYRDAGFAVDPAARELPDHVGAELTFMALLAAEEAAAWREGDFAAARDRRRRQRDFLDAHLARWAPDLAGRVLEATAEPFYRALAVALREHVALERERLGGAAPVVRPNGPFVSSD